MKVIIRTLQGLENILAEELILIGAQDIEVLTRAVACELTQEQLYMANHLLRTAIKVMVPIKEVTIFNEYHLYNQVKDIEWENYFGLNQTFAIDAVTNSEFFRHSHYVALKSKDAIADRFRDIFDKRPFVNPVSPDLNIVIHIRQNILTVLLDASGESLHMRGYRMYPVEAPLNEVLAAGLIGLSGWDKKSTLVDPMCGSGTILIEAAMWAGNIPPQLDSRKYCFMNWKDFDNDLWKKVKTDARAKINMSAIPEMIGRDKQLKAVSATKTNAVEKGIDDKIKVARADFFTSEGMENVTLIMNPPYDERLKVEDVTGFYKNIGDKFKKDYNGCNAWVFSGNMEALKHLGLKASKRIKLLNGDIESSFNKFEIYEGTK